MKEHLLQYIDQSKTAFVRGLRILVEYFYATEIFEPIVRSDIKIVSVFGSARTKVDTPEYEDAHQLGALLYENGYAVVTGASAGIMQAANEGVAYAIIKKLKKRLKLKTDAQVMASKDYEAMIKKASVGLKISLPFEPTSNPYVGVVATFHYFMVRKFFFGTLSSAFIACEGGWGTRDEFFEILTLVQTGKAPLMPIIYVSPDPEHLQVDLNFCLKKKYIDSDDIHLIDIVPDNRQAVAIINRFYKVVDKISYDKPNTVQIDLKKEVNDRQKKALASLIKTHQGIVTKAIYGPKRIELTGFNYKSYGVIRKMIDGLNDCAWGYFF